MTQIENILKSKIKPKEKVLLLAANLKENPRLMNELTEYFAHASIANRGACIEAITHITNENPEFAENHLGFIIDQIDDEAPRVKWEASTIITNIAAEFPIMAAKAIPNLMNNTSYDGTVVRWSAAKALTEIARQNPKTQSELIPFFSKIIDFEVNNGVKNIYVKALRALSKNK